jgi:prepilin-type N-terminal cleavage/methylation domain-containing protein
MNFGDHNVRRAIGGLSAPRRSPCADAGAQNPKSEIRNSKQWADKPTIRISNSEFRIADFAAKRRGLTLIELLVTIVILVTVLAAALPAISPNNDGRRIREAARGLQSYIAQAQAQAARTGRGHGVYFKKLSADTGNADDRGVCLEVYHMEEPQPFAGFSENSRVRIEPAAPIGGNATYTLRFVLAATPTGNPAPDDYQPDPLPPEVVAKGDSVVIDGVKYFVIDEDRDGVGGDESPGTFLTGMYYTLPSNPANFNKSTLRVGLETGQSQPTLSPSGPLERYLVRRQPVRGAEKPYQLPSRTCVDLQSSGMPVTITPSCCHNPLTSISGLSSMQLQGLTSNDDGIGVLFGPNGAIEKYIWNKGNAQNFTGAPPVAENDASAVGQTLYFLVGLRENVPTPGVTFTFWDFFAKTAEDRLADAQKVNWLHPESNWVVISAAGRVLSSENKTIDLSLQRFSNPSGSGTPTLNDLMLALPNQMHDARQFAREMTGQGGG